MGRRSYRNGRYKCVLAPPHMVSECIFLVLVFRSHFGDRFLLSVPIFSRMVCSVSLIVFLLKKVLKGFFKSVDSKLKVLRFNLRRELELFVLAIYAVAAPVLGYKGAPATKFRTSSLELAALCFVWPSSL